MEEEKDRKLDSTEGKACRQMGSNEALTVAILNSRWVSIFALASTINVHFGSSNSVADLITFPRAALLSSTCQLDSLYQKAQRS